ncbi:MAG: hypothetical protein WCK97_03040 [Actinomycetes bacterium]
MSRTHAHRTVGFLVLRGGRLYLRLRFPNLARQLITAAASIVAIGVLITLVVTLTGRSDVNSMTP